ncbi:MAG: hypothetical protein RLZZ517_116 [Candidatus Parcubacteria bacterium]
MRHIESICSFKTMKMIVWPVACELAFHPDGSEDVILGPETSIACAQAFAHCSNYPMSDWRIIPCAGRPRKGEFAEVVMSYVMAEYLEQLGAFPRNVIPLIGKTFNTQGEARAIAEFLHDNREVKHLVIVGKWWHMLRAYEWIWVYLNKFDIADVTVEVVATETTLGPSFIHKEFWWAIPINKIRMMFAKYFG